MSAATTIIETPAILADVTRRKIGSIGVDGGVITCQASNGGFYDDDGDGGGDHIYRGVDAYGTAWCDTGFGDGGYDIVETVAGDGSRVGIEVAFYSTALETEIDQVVAELWGGPEPSPAERVASHKPDADADLVAQVRRWHALHQELWDGAGSRMGGFDPAAEGAAQLIGAIEVPVSDRAGVVISGPGTSGGDLFELPPGSYTAVAWVENDTCLRFGLYLTI